MPGMRVRSVPNNRVRCWLRTNGSSIGRAGLGGHLTLGDCLPGTSGAIAGSSVGGFPGGRLQRADRGLDLLITRVDKLLVVRMGLPRLLQGEQMFGAPVTLQGLDQGVGAGFDPAISQRGQAGGVPFTGQDWRRLSPCRLPRSDRRWHGARGCSSDRTISACAARFAHAAFTNCIAMPKQGAQRAHLLGRSKGAAQQSGRVQMAQPLAVGYVALAARCRAHQTSVDQHHLKAACFQDLERWNPVHSRRLHGDGRDLAFREPVRQRMQIAGERRRSCGSPGWRGLRELRRTPQWRPHPDLLPRDTRPPAAPCVCRCAAACVEPWDTSTIGIQVGRPRREQTAFSLSGWPPPAGVDLTNDSATGLGTKLDYGFAPAGGHQ